jgi:hypothetical protein
MTATAVSLDRVEELMLARLVTCGKSRVKPEKVRQDLAPLFRHPPGGDQWQAHTDTLVEAGLLTPKPYRLTEAGRARALEFLGVEALPPRTTWKTVCTRYLMPKALGLPTDAALPGRLSEAKLGAFVLKAKHALPVKANASLPQVLEALVCKELGFPQEVTLKGVQTAKLMRLLGTNEPLTTRQLQEQLPRHLLGASKGGKEGLQEAILKRWLDGEEPVASREPFEEVPARAEAVAEPVFDLPAFAATARAAARDCPTGRFGPNKVFINHVWRHLGQEPSVPRLDLDAFKARLVEANRAGLLHLSRADLVEVMDPADVQESETPYLNAVFHFVLLQE